MLDCLDQPRQFAFTTCDTATRRLKLGVISRFRFDFAARITLNHSAAFRLTVRYIPDVELSSLMPLGPGVEIHVALLAMNPNNSRANHLFFGE